MNFCEDCDGLMIPDKSGKKKVVCSKCGKGAKGNANVMIKEKISNNKDKIEVVDKEIEVNPQVDANCSKCNHNRAYFWTLQTRAADESETRFYKCVKCSYRWREYS